MAISDGTQHRLYGVGITPTGEIETPANVKPGSDTNYAVTVTSGTGAPLEGSSSSQNRVVDVDNDGRPDIVSFTPNPVVYWNGELDKPGKIGQRPGEPIDFVNNHDIDPVRADV